MSFSAIRSVATSALMAAQVRMEVASSNIANADVDGYSRQTAVQVSTTAGNTGTGTTVTAVTSTVDKYLLADVVAASTELGAATATAEITDALQSLFGSTTSSDDTGTSIADTITDLESSISSLAGTAESTTLNALVVDDLDAVATQLRELSSGVQDLRAQADSEIADSVETVNAALDTIATLNDKIVAAKALGQSTAALEDQRSAALETLSAELDVTYLVKSNGEMRVSTSSGTVLVDSAAHHLDYTVAAQVTADTSFADITVDGVAITGQISTGRIGALLEQRDEVLTGVQDSLDALATQLIDSINAVHNTGSSLPAPSVLTGTTEVSGSDALDATGALRVALTDSSGALVSYADLELSDYATVDDLVTALSGIDGVSASVSDGVLSLTSTAGYGISVADIDSSVDGAGFSEYFGLNDALVGTGAASIAVRSDILAGTVALATATLDTSESLATGDTALAISSSLVLALQDALAADQSFAAAGGLVATSTDLASYAAMIVSEAATDASSAETKLETAQNGFDSADSALSSLTGVNVDEETAALSALEQYYATAAQILEVLNAMFDALLSAAKS